MQLKQLKYLLILLLAIPFKLTAAYTQPQNIDTAEIGFYVDDIYDINYVKGTYRVNIFIWATSYTVNYDFEKYLDVHHAIDKKIELVMMDSSNTINGRKIYWSEIRLNVEVLQKFDISKFPFDNQPINIGLEFAYNDPKLFKINLSKKNSISPKSVPNDWKINSSKYFLKPFHYTTNFGAPGVNSFTFEVLHIEYNFSRNSFTLFIKLFFALFIAFLISCSSLFLPNINAEAKISMIIGGLFGSITNKYITDSLLPVNNTWDLSDKIHSLTIFYLLFLSLYTIYEQRKKLKDNLKKDLAIFLITIFSYSIFIFLFITK
jgi:hypothetical protein